jgi:hypothetical protein
LNNDLLGIVVRLSRAHPVRGLGRGLFVTDETLVFTIERWRSHCAIDATGFVAHSDLTKSPERTGVRMNSLLPTAVRAIAAALAVFMTTATLNGLISIAEPQQSQLMAQTAARQMAQVATSARDDVTIAQAPASTTSR